MRVQNIFSGIYTEQDFKNIKYSKYNGVMGGKSADIENTEKFVELINSINKPRVTIVDYGGGAAGTFLYVKENVTKNINYNIIELKESFLEIENLTYHDTNNCNIDFEIDILYSNATIYCTFGTTVKENINKICNLKPKSILLQQTMCHNGNTDIVFTLDIRNGYLFSIPSENFLIKKITEFGYNLEYIVHNHPEKRKFIISNIDNNDIGDIFYKNLFFIK